MLFDRLKRRAFIKLLGGAAAAWPLAASAQEPRRIKRIGFVTGLADGTEARLGLGPFRDGLAALGWTEARDIEIVSRSVPS
jgi:putative ABC transport system substrate-binding protein